MDQLNRALQAQGGGQGMPPVADIMGGSEVGVQQQPQIDPGTVQALAQIMMQSGQTEAVQQMLAAAGLGPPQEPQQPPPPGLMQGY